MKRTTLLIACLMATYSLLAQKIEIASIPREILYTHHNDDFTVCVRSAGGEWRDLYEYKVMVDMDDPQLASMVQFDFEGRVEIRIKLNNGVLNSAQIRPLSKGIDHTTDNNYIYFSLDKPTCLSVEVNGDRLHNLHLFANPMQSYIPTPETPGVIYFGEGVHKPADDSGVFNIPSNTTVYLASGAVVNGKFLCDGVENVRFVGRGIVLEPERGFELRFSKNIEIEGITVINPTHYTVYGGQVTGLKIKGLRSFSCIGWSDGIDLMSCSDVEIDDVFMRNSDDCIAIYTHRWDYHGDARNYRINNAILWADVAHPINIGLHGDTSHGGYTVENLRFNNIDILEHDEDDRNYQGCMAFSVSDHNLVRDVVFDNIRVERIEEGQLFNMRVLFNEKYSSGPGRGIREVTFRNVSYYDRGENSGIIEGFSKTNTIENITFENIVINGKRAKTLDDLNLRVGKFASKIKVK